MTEPAETTPAAPTEPTAALVSTNDPLSGRTILREARPGEVAELVRTGQGDRVHYAGAAHFREAEQSAELARRVADEGPLDVAGRAAANALTAGLYAPIARHADPLGDLVARGAAEDRPIADAAGSIAGLLPSLFIGSGEASIASRLAGLTAPGMAARLGVNAGAAAERFAINRGLSAGAARAAGAIAGSGADAFASGAALALQDSLVRDEPLTAERLASTAGLTGLLGLGLGIGGVALGRGAEGLLAGRQARRAAVTERLEAAGMPEAAGRVSGRPQRNWYQEAVRRYSSGGTPEQLDIITDPVNRGYIREGSDGVARAVRETADLADGHVQLMDELAPSTAQLETRLGATVPESETLRGVVHGVREELPGTPASRVYESPTPGAAPRWREVPGTPGGSRVVQPSVFEEAAARIAGAGTYATAEAREMAAHAAGLLNATRQAAEAGTPARAVAAMADAWNGLAGIRAPGTLSGTALRETSEISRLIEQSRGQFQALLQREDVVGPQAQSFARFFETRGRFHTIQAQLLRDAGRVEAQTGRQVIDGDKLNRMFSEASSLRTDRRQNVFETYLDTADEYRHALEDVFGPRPETSELLTAQTTQTRASMEAGIERARAVNVDAAVQGEERGSAGFSITSGITAAGTAGVLGGLLGGPVGAAAGATGSVVFGALSRPASFLKTMDRLSDGVARFLGRRTAATTRLRQTLQGAGRSGSRLTRSALQRVERTLPETIVGLNEPPARRRAEYEHLAEEIRQLSSDPQALENRLAGMMDRDVQREFPGIAGRMQGQAVTGLSYLAQSLPPASQPTAFGSLDRIPPSLAEVDAFRRRAGAVEDPVSVFEHAADLTVTADEVEALAAVYPHMLRDLQADVSIMISELDELPPYQVRVALGTLLQVPADQSLAPDFIMRMQRTASQTTLQDQAQVSSNVRFEIGRQTTTAQQATQEDLK